MCCSASIGAQAVSGADVGSEGRHARVERRQHPQSARRPRGAAPPPPPPRMRSAAARPRPSQSSSPSLFRRTERRGAALCARLRLRRSEHRRRRAVGVGTARGAHRRHEGVVPMAACSACRASHAARERVAPPRAAVSLKPAAAA